MANKTGWVAGDIIASDSDPGRGRWLTVWGSYYTAPELHATREAATGDKRRGATVAHVTELYMHGVGRVYQVTPDSAEPRAELGAVGTASHA